MTIQTDDTDKISVLVFDPESCRVRLWQRSAIPFLRQPFLPLPGLRPDTFGFESIMRATRGRKGLEGNEGMLDARTNMVTLRYSRPSFASDCLHPPPCHHRAMRDDAAKFILGRLKFYDSDSDVRGEPIHNSNQLRMSWLHYCMQFHQAIECDRCAMSEPRVCFGQSPEDSNYPPLLQKNLRQLERQPNRRIKAAMASRG